MSQDRIQLVIPARPEYASAVRMLAGALVTSHQDTPYDIVDEVRIAINEAFIYALDMLGENGDVHIAFTLGDDAAFGAELQWEAPEEEEEESGASTSHAMLILEAFCDECELTSREGGKISLRIVIRLEADDVA